MENLCENGVAAIAEIQEIFDASGVNTQILAASFKTAREVIDVALTGAAAATVSSDIMRKLLIHPATDVAIKCFASDWQKAFGDTTLLKLLR